MGPCLAHNVEVLMVSIYSVWSVCSVCQGLFCILCICKFSPLNSSDPPVLASGVPRFMHVPLYLVSLLCVHTHLLDLEGAGPIMMT